MVTTTNSKYGVISQAPIVASALGATVIVAAVSGQKIYVLGWDLVASAAVSVKWQDGITDISGVYPIAVNGGAVVPRSMIPCLITSSGNALNINLASAVSVGGSITYIQSAVDYYY